jgi:diguanylate cyclase (GGDEF)-like protein
LGIAPERNVLLAAIVAAAATLVGIALVAVQSGAAAGRFVPGPTGDPLHANILVLCMSVTATAWVGIASLRLAQPGVAGRACGTTDGAADANVSQHPLWQAATHQRFDAALAVAAATRTGAALFVVDIDRYRALISMHGSLVADDMLHAFADRLAALVPRAATLSALSGDAFGIVLPHADLDDAGYAADALLAALARPLVAGGSETYLAASIGVAVAPAHGATADALLRAALLAVGQAKAAGGDTWRMFEAGLRTAVADRRTLHAELRHGLDTGQFVPFYQPIVSLAHNSIVGMEVLARWRHPERGLLTPDLFIRQMEEQHLCAPLSLSLLRQVSEDARHWPGHWTFAFNASPGQLGELLNFVRGPVPLPASMLAPSRIELEVTETALIDDMPLARRVVQAMHRGGAKVVLDDFGTGYANVLQLRELPFDRIKIDRQFITDMALSARTDACVNAMLGLARALGATVIAEGVEDAATAQKLRGMGCDFAQGFFYGAPMPAAEVSSLGPTVLAA